MFCLQKKNEHFGKNYDLFGEAETPFRRLNNAFFGVLIFADNVLNRISPRWVTFSSLETKIWRRCELERFFCNWIDFCDRFAFLQTVNLVHCYLVFVVYKWIQVPSRNWFGLRLNNFKYCYERLHDSVFMPNLSCHVILHGSRFCSTWAYLNKNTDGKECVSAMLFFIPQL